MIIVILGIKLHTVTIKLKYYAIYNNEYNITASIKYFLMNVLYMSLKTNCKNLYSHLHRCAFARFFILLISN